LSVVAIIPARGGSKSVPRKNLRTVRGITLVERSIIHARESGKVDRIIVSSDDEEILSLASDCGAEPLRRPDELATDTANGDDVLIHALRSIGCSEDTVNTHLTVMLLPTAPIREPRTIRWCVEMVETGSCDSVLTVYEGHFAWRRTEFARQEEFGYAYEADWVPVTGNVHTRKNRQEISWRDKLFIENGSVYVTRTAMLIREGHRLSGRIETCTMSKEDSIDVDTEYDLWLAEMRAQYLREELRTFRMPKAVTA
jgi:N-acylneuraminate cytidylyltransferase